MSKLNKTSIYIIAPIAIALLLLSVSFSNQDNSDDKDCEISSSIKITQLYIPDSIYIFNELVPIENFDTRESLERELLVNTYWQSSTSMFMKKVQRYFPIMEHIFSKHGIPTDFKYLALAESGFRNVMSPAGAGGFWQFLERTGKEYGLEVNKYVDERYHVEKATEAACKYLKKSQCTTGLGY